MPSSPSAPTKVLGLSSVSSIAVEWTELTSQALLVTTYNLYMDDGFGVNFNIVYSGTGFSQVIENLTPGNNYNFYLTATNFNGEGPKSLTVSYPSCVLPSNVLAPELVVSTSTTAFLRWQEPVDGGCPITSFSVFSDLGNFNAGFINNLASAFV